MREVRHIDIAFEPGKRQMGMIEGIVWDEYCRQFAMCYDRIGVNVPVWLDPPEKRGVLKQSKRCLVDPPSYRVDAIAGKDGIVELIEVKETGNMTAIGQLLTYRMLFNRTYWNYEGLKLRLVCRRAPAPIRFACEKLGIDLTELGDSIKDQVNSARRGIRELRVVDQG
ncbi:hypothetical protein ES705_23162 [subsurface metagenome]